MLSQNHIHRPSLDRYVVKYHESLRGIEYKRVGRAYNILQYGKKIKRLDLKKENDVFD